jgi:hypothetical protein
MAAEPMAAGPPRPLLTPDGIPLVGCESVERAILDRLEGSAPVVLVVLFGKPGRGKTSLAHAVGRSRADWFDDVNASSERRSEELRQRLSRFLSDGDQHALRARRGGGAGASALPARPLGVLFLDEADGLGPIGQATVASFVADLEDGMLPARRGWRACVIIACNDMGALHDSLLSRAHVLAEMPRPDVRSLVAAARLWIEAELERERADPQPQPASQPHSQPHSQDEAAEYREHPGNRPEGRPSLPPVLPDDDHLASLAVRADGDYRSMRQLLGMALSGVGEAGCAGEGPSAAASGLGREGPLRCPRPLMRALLTGDGQDDLSLWARIWREGHRADVVQQWVELAASDPKVAPERRVRLLRFRAQLADGSRPSTLLQMVGAFARTVALGK